MMAKNGAAFGADGFAESSALAKQQARQRQGRILGVQLLNENGEQVAMPVLNSSNPDDLQA